MQQVAKEVGRDLRGTSLNLADVFASTHQRPYMFKAGLLPNIQENPYYRKLTKRGCERLFNTAIHALRTHGEQTFVWED